MNKEADIGVIGLGVMGRNLSLNFADRGYSVVGYDKDADKVRALSNEGGGSKVAGAEEIHTFISKLRTPRSIIILVPAGGAVDAVINDLRPYLEKGDLIIDGGNSHYRDTDRRSERLSEGEIRFIGMGISGGEAGARHGPSMMPGGDHSAYQHVKPILEAAAAKVEDQPCVTYLGPRSAGHYVKMVHNGIEYGLMQLIAESYDLMKRGLGMEDAGIAEVFSKWRTGDLQGYLIEITADIFKQPDELVGGRLIDHILDAARQNGTGMWTAQSSMDLQVPVPTIDAAVAMRNLSAEREHRLAISNAWSQPIVSLDMERAEFVPRLKDALYAAMILTYAQGMDLLSVASRELEYDLDLEEVARIWRGGCISRSALLEPIRSAYQSQPDLEPLLLDESLGKAVASRAGSLTAIANAAISARISAPAFLASLAYFDGLRSAWLPANLIQAQRDDFGAHRYERIDRQGTFHTEWGKI
ncbi:MAG: NADP-dependent phosphogluconate dehydrogenase [Anaerolineales bacterium]|jgi:6-phosphogluconate dehydrogenase